jgi:D-sedoheptulose 7-phosphate isomerase
VTAPALADYLDGAAALLRETAAAGLDRPVAAAVAAIAAALAAGKPLLVCGNGGSAADAMHIAGELVGRYRLERPGLKAIALGADAAVTTAWANDYAFDSLFAREVEALGEDGGVVWAISTSGESENVVRALEAGRARGMTTVALTGAGGGRLADHADVLIAVPARDTPRVQEVHTCLYHYICEQVERAIAGRAAP